MMLHRSSARFSSGVPVRASRCGALELADRAGDRGVRVLDRSAPRRGSPRAARVSCHVVEVAAQQRVVGDDQVVARDSRGAARGASPPLASISTRRPGVKRAASRTQLCITEAGHTTRPGPPSGSARAGAGARPAPGSSCRAPCRRRARRRGRASRCRRGSRAPAAGRDAARRRVPRGTGTAAGRGTPRLARAALGSRALRIGAQALERHQALGAGLRELPPRHALLAAAELDAEVGEHSRTSSRTSGTSRRTHPRRA